MAGYGLDPVRQANGGTIRANNFSDGNGYRIAATAPSAFFEGDLVTSAGATVSFYPLGSVLMIQSEASQTYTTGLLVYAGASGQVIDSNDHTSKVVGVYVGTGEAVGAGGAGTLIPVNTAGHVTA